MYDVNMEPVFDTIWIGFSVFSYEGFFQDHFITYGQNINHSCPFKTVTFM